MCFRIISKTVYLKIRHLSKTNIQRCFSNKQYMPKTWEHREPKHGVLITLHVYSESIQHHG